MASNPKSVLITGAGSGIGRETALALAGRGHKLHATTHTQEQAAWWAGKGLANVNALKLDITVREDRERARDLDIDVLISNAAIGDTGSLAEVPMERVRATFETNLFATLELAQVVVERMLVRRSGTLIFISSLAGRLPSPFMMPYAMTKFALSAAADALRDELKMLNSGVHVVVVEPGAYLTGFNQEMMAKKYVWMKERSHFRDMIPSLKVMDQRWLYWLEVADTRSIVTRIVWATEADRPRFRYVAPWWQGAGVRVLRAFGK